MFYTKGYQLKSINVPEHQRSLLSLALSISPLAILLPPFIVWPTPPIGPPPSHVPSMRHPVISCTFFLPFRPGLRLGVFTVPRLFFCFSRPEFVVCCLLLPFRPRLRLWVFIMPWLFFCFPHPEPVVLVPLRFGCCRGVVTGCQAFRLFWALLVQCYCLIGCAPVGAIFPSGPVAFFFSCHSILLVFLLSRTQPA